MCGTTSGSSSNGQVPANSNTPGVSFFASFRCPEGMGVLRSLLGGAWPMTS